MDNHYEQLSKERKQMQAEGTIPDFFSTASWQLFKAKYLYEADTVKDQYRRIARTAAYHMPQAEQSKWEEKFFELFWKGWLSPSTPVLANMGTDRGLPVSCSGQYIGDSIYDFYSSRLETAMLTKHGFGTSGYFGDVRPRGSKISVGGTASGIVPVFKGFVEDMRLVAQGTARRGAFAAYLPPTHGDFDEMVHFVESNPDDANLGWTIKDEFIQALDSHDREMDRRFKRMMKLKMVQGKGYYHFVDKVNRRLPDAYKNNNLKVTSSNLCFSGDTQVMVLGANDTPMSFMIRDLAAYNKEFYVYSADKIRVPSRHKNKIRWQARIRKALAFKTGEKEIIRLTLSDSSQFKCTPDHQLATSSGQWISAFNSVGVELASSSKSKKSLVVSSIEKLGVQETYDLTVDADNYDSHSFYILPTDSYDGEQAAVLVHNCSEINLFQDSEHTYTCVLSSMNIAKYDEWKDTDAVFNAICFLHCVALEFIKKAEHIPGLEKAVRFTKKGMSLGLGAAGYHTYLQEHMIPFESVEALVFNNKLFKGIREKAEEGSRYLATIFGEPEWCKGTGKANTHLLAVAPTKTTAGIMGGISEGINPDPAMTYTQLTAAGEIDRVNPALIKLMRHKGVYTKKFLDEVIVKNGSVQDVDWLDGHEKLVFKHAFEIDQYMIIRKASQRQRFIDQGQSTNLFFGDEEDESVIAGVHEEAFKDENIHSLYYIYSKAGVKGSTGMCEVCQ